MKKFFKGLGSLLWRHKLLTLICILAFAVIAIMMYIFFSVFLGGTDKYGNRLNGIEEVELTKKELKEIEDWVKDTKSVSNVSVRVVGRIVYVDIEFNSDTNLNSAKDLAGGVLSKFDDKEKAFYDFEFIMSENKEGGFKVTGTKGPKFEGISWIKS